MELGLTISETAGRHKLRYCMNSDCVYLRFPVCGTNLVNNVAFINQVGLL